MQYRVTITHTGITKEEHLCLNKDYFSFISTERLLFLLNNGLSAATAKCRSHCHVMILSYSLFIIFC